MKAILNVNINSAYSNLNGLTFEVVGLTNKTVTLHIKGASTDFSHSEILIVDFEAEVCKAYIEPRNLSDYQNTYDNLCSYGNIHNISNKVMQNLHK